MCHGDFVLIDAVDNWRSRRRQFAWPETAVVVEVVNQQAQTEHARGVDGNGGSGATRRYCICSPTRHPGSFRCRYHRSEFL